MSNPARRVAGTVLALSAMALLGAGLVIPFRYESFSILYKFGAEKTLLRAGKMAGISLALLVLVQVVLASRFLFLELVFSKKTVLQMHRYNGLLIALLAICHPLLIKASENFTPYTFEQKYYPEFLGIALFSSVLLVSGFAYFRSFLRLSYQGWLILHRTGATLALVLLPAHILWVSDTFKQGLPRNAAVVVVSLALFLAGRIWSKRVFLRAK